LPPKALCFGDFLEAVGCVVSIALVVLSVSPVGLNLAAIVTGISAISENCWEVFKS